MQKRVGAEQVLVDMEQFEDEPETSFTTSNKNKAKGAGKKRKKSKKKKEEEEEENEKRERISPCAGMYFRMDCNYTYFREHILHLLRTYFTCI